MRISDWSSDVCSSDLTKDELLERYLSNAYFGDNTYGLRAASLHYFYRHPEKLTPAQAALLAGLVQAPSRLAPTRNPDLAEKRMHLVMNRSEARRVGKEGVRTCRFRWSRYH